MRARFVPVLVPVIAAMAFAGCALKEPPARDAIAADALANLRTPLAWTASPVMVDPVEDNWLAAFADPVLDELVGEALSYNPDLRIAAARVEVSAGYARLAGSTIYPTVNVLAHGGGKLGGDGSGLSGAWLMASWELDLWGRVRAEREAGAAGLEAARLDEAFARQSIAAHVAKAWILAIEARLQRRVAAEIAGLSDRSLGLARDRLRVGQGNEYDVALAQASLDTAIDAERQFAYAEAQAVRAIETLVGRYPGAALAVADRLPGLPERMPAGLPVELLDRRPDVRAAERRVAAAFYGIEEAQAARWPKISLTAGLSSVSSSLFVLQERSNPIAALGGNLLWPVFNGYALAAQVDIRTAEQRLAIAEFGRVGARAFGEVEGAISALATSIDREAILARAVASNARALELAEIRFRVGSDDLRAVIAQTVALSGSRTALLRVQSERRVQRVNVHLALGGSFETAPAVPREPAADGGETVRTASGAQSK
jgi:NodT family efflux transporter outer membrane factor (OMF) lipoprotein